jgi:hypothetical protein
MKILPACIRAVIDNIKRSFLEYRDYGINYFYHWVVPKWVAQTYRNILCNTANYMVVTSRLANSLISVNIETFRASMEQAKGMQGIVQSNL